MNILDAYESMEQWNWKDHLQFFLKSALKMSRDSMEEENGIDSSALTVQDPKDWMEALQRLNTDIMCTL